MIDDNGQQEEQRQQRQKSDEENDGEFHFTIPLLDSDESATNRCGSNDNDDDVVVPQHMIDKFRRGE